jgi:hypothetical protein
MGWAYQLLQFLDEEPLYRIGTEVELQRTIVRAYNCPSRRRPTLYGGTGGSTGNGTVLMDYAAATPSVGWNKPGDALGDISESMWQGNTWDTPSNKTWRGVIVRTNTSIWHTGSGCTTGHSVNSSPPTSPEAIRDGESNTMVIAEKRLHIDRYYSGDWHDDRGWTDGWDPDVIRTTTQPPAQDGMSDVSGEVGYQFGSAHTTLQSVFADGSVHSLSYQIAPVVFNCLGNREDDQPMPASAF